MEHYSSRFGRNFQDDDLLLHPEALQVISANSGGIRVPGRHLSDLVDQGRLTGEVVVPYRIRLYKYSEVKNETYQKGPGRHKHESPTPNALRQRAWKEKQKLKKVG